MNNGHVNWIDWFWHLKPLKWFIRTEYNTHWKGVQYETFKGTGLHILNGPNGRCCDGKRLPMSPWGSCGFQFLRRAAPLSG